MRLNKLQKSFENFSDNNDNNSNSQKVVLTDEDRFYYEKRYVEGTSIKLPETTYELAHSRWLDSLPLEALRDMYSEYLRAINDSDEKYYTKRKMVEAGYWDSSLKDEPLAG